ncbi:MAG: manganese efflux pump [Erysipelotrichaceae bacterium]|nr:manganese efflux pump [Erysipelotrichaceae bacterium]
MGVIELFMVAVGLSMDAFAISICKGLTLRKMEWDKSLITGIYFGFFQAMMPLIGYVLGIQFSQSITNFDHWIAFILLSYIGINMIKESKEDETQNQSFGFKTMLPLAIASSIDALAVGITFAFLNVNIINAVIFIGITTFIFSFFGVKIGNVFGSKYKSKAELCGGIILILMGVKILIEHLFF